MGSGGGVAERGCRAHIAAHRACHWKRGSVAVGARSGLPRHGISRMVTTNTVAFHRIGRGLAMAVLNAVSIAEIKARGSIKDADVLKLRRNYYDDGSISAEEADVIFALNDACPVQDPAWADCFVETITDYLVEQAEPQGYLTADNAQWLIERIGRDGRVDSKTELELLVNVHRQGPLGAAEPGSLRPRAGQARGDHRHRAAARWQEARARHRVGDRRRSAAPHPLRRRQRRQHRHHPGRSRGAVRHRRGHLRPRQPPGLDRSFRQGDRQLRDGGVGLCRPAARGRACPRGLARPPRRALPRRHAGRHGLGPEGSVRRLSRADDGGARHRRA